MWNRARYSAAILLSVLLLNVSSCTGEAVEMPAAEVMQPVSSPPPVTEELQLPATATITPAPSSTAAPILSATATLKVPAATEIEASIQPASPVPLASASATPTADRSFEAAVELAQAVPPARDNVRLATAFGGLDQAALAAPAELVVEPFKPGARQSFKVLDVVNNTHGEIEAKLFAIGDHAYFWFETEPFGIDPDEDTLAETVSEFDDIYRRVTGLFGQENSPGIDGDPRLHVLHASPQTICGVSEDGAGGCATAGFVSSSDLQPAALNPQSNEREMFVMNDRQFGSDYYLGVLAHELRHLVEFNYDVADTDWGKEGSAVLAAELAGLPSSGIDRANQFLSAPDQQLNSWTDMGKGPYYGQGFLLNQYLYDRLGEDLYREFAMSPLPGFIALDSLAAQHGLKLSGESLWLDWLAALALHDHPQAAEKHRFDLDGLETAALSPIDPSSLELAGEVRQFAADYYEVPDTLSTLEFAGTEFVPLLEGQDDAGETFWYAQRANSSNPRLTRALDLRGTEAATLAYDVYVDIEYGYDYAYVSVSTDGGTTWQPLAASSMQGLDPADDPSGSALTPRYYTGRTREWRHEISDLTPFTGQEILLRFEMVTDPILTYSGLAVDNVAVPEIGFFDQGIQEGWTAEGFTLTTSTLPQPWHLRLITFPPDGPLVQALPVSSDGRALITIEEGASQQRPILIIAASAPMTLEPAGYSIILRE